MSLLLLFSRRQPVGNRGRASILVTQAIGTGLIVVEEISGSAEISVTQATGAGRVIQPAPAPDRTITAGPVRQPRRRNIGRGHAQLAAPFVRGRGRLVYQPISGAGSAGLQGLQALGRGRLELPRLAGAGASELPPLEALGSGLLRLPELPPAPPMAAAAAPWEPDYEPQAAAPARRRAPAKAAALDEDEELLLLMETLK